MASPSFGHTSSSRTALQPMVSVCIVRSWNVEMHLVELHIPSHSAHHCTPCTNITSDVLILLPKLVWLRLPVAFAHATVPTLHALTVALTRSSDAISHDLLTRFLMTNTTVRRPSAA
jgi:hypothetical protein